MKKYFASYVSALGSSAISFGSVWFRCERLTVAEIEGQSAEVARRNGYSKPPVFISILEIEED